MKLRTIGYAAIIAVAAVALAIGSATTGEAKGKKKKAPAPPPPQPQVCLWQQTAPVCGSLKGQKFTYANSCAAYKDGASVVSNKACSAKKAKTGKAKKAKKSAKKKKM